VLAYLRKIIFTLLAKIVTCNKYIIGYNENVVMAMDYHTCDNFPNLLILQRYDYKRDDTYKKCDEKMIILHIEEDDYNDYDYEQIYYYTLYVNKCNTNFEFINNFRRKFNYANVKVNKNNEDIYKYHLNIYFNKFFCEFLDYIEKLLIKNACK
jgi:hypothetical protein